MKRIFRFIKALYKYIKSGRKVSFNEFNNRISICTECDKRDEYQCGICGCYLAKKAQWSTESCPQNKW